MTALLKPRTIPDKIQTSRTIADKIQTCRTVGLRPFSQSHHSRWESTNRGHISSACFTGQAFPSWPNSSCACYGSDQCRTRCLHGQGGPCMDPISQPFGNGLGEVFPKKSNLKRKTKEPFHCLPSFSRRNTWTEIMVENQWINSRVVSSERIQRNVCFFQEELVELLPPDRSMTLGT